MILPLKPNTNSSAMTLISLRPRGSLNCLRFFPFALTALHDDDPLLYDLGRERTVSRNVRILSSCYRSAALRCLAADKVMSRHSINSLQSLILIIYARIQCDLPTWSLLGFAHYTAICMGCHVDPERFALGRIEREERRRAWAGLRMLCVNQNVISSSLSAFLSSLTKTCFVFTDAV
jgi:hypothetical protein